MVSRLNWKRSIIFPSLKDGSEERVLDFMERSTIKLLEKRGNTNTQIARVLGRDMKTVSGLAIDD